MLFKFLDYGCGGNRQGRLFAGALFGVRKGGHISKCPLQNFMRSTICIFPSNVNGLKARLQLLPPKYQNARKTPDQFSSFALRKECDASRFQPGSRESIRTNRRHFGIFDHSGGEMNQGTSGAEPTLHIQKNASRGNWESSTSFVKTLRRSGSPESRDQG
jgi:hypothetical protein